MVLIGKTSDFSFGIDSIEKGNLSAVSVVQLDFLELKMLVVSECKH